MIPNRPSLIRGKQALTLAITVGFLTAAALPQSTQHSRLRKAMASAMAGRSGSVVMLSLYGGRVIASHNLWLAANRRATPGSTIKPFVLRALLRDGQLNPSVPVACHRHLRIAGHEVNCVHPETPAELSASEALAYSCNSYFAQAAAKLAPGELEDELARDGFTSPTGLLRREIAGAIRKTGSLPERQLLALGLSGIEITPLELARGYGELALQMRSQPDSEVTRVLRAGLQGSTAYGIGHLAQPQTLSVAGKTGTASSPQTPQTHAWFAGYAPSGNPQIVVVVYLENGHGGADAAAVASAVFAGYQADSESQ